VSTEHQQICLAVCRFSQDEFRRVAKLKQSFRSVIQSRALGNQFSQAPQSLFDGARATVELFVVFDDVDQREPGAEFFRESGGQGCIRI
jgi:hypothetical protein